jgi:quercetin dioxygenase-like cupin family protein
MIHAFKLSTGADGASHVQEGSIANAAVAKVTDARFAESPPHSSLDWHDAPERQYVITLSGTLEFTTRDGETFTLRPGDVLVAADVVGTGHRWRLIDDRPWCRAYVVLAADADDGFVGSER